MLQQLYVMMAQQNQTFQAAIQAQMQQTQAQMRQAQAQFDQLILQQGGRGQKKDPPVYECKTNEDLELWIFATEEYYASSRVLMDADSSHFVTMISSNLGKTVLIAPFHGNGRQNDERRLGGCSSTSREHAIGRATLSTYFASGFSS